MSRIAHNLEKINQSWFAYDSYGNSWKIVKRRGYYDAFVNDKPREWKMERIHYLCEYTLKELAKNVHNFGGHFKTFPNVEN